ncbi:sodium/proton antiporter, NhaA family (TC 2.A.33.1.1) [Marinactinospora thermotolerans DSM 45154]|uniref:Na(+)/H(+) antiporter NhaA n=2 Tax=Marinactinospora thermotolerans TaxID=531310 RepID=A0A1T4TIQ2_9ACTN|nr:sodium/proton antiporter, NhaA family [Marinactinospora thermotolerans DSM 45154]SKA40180.1 sodium/proton antiporter, NhaA family (TC 2.A.33.1.1) [Marinactinospora thermotolerans DSM 45154]
MAMTSRLADALRRDTVGGFLLIGAAVIALVWANSPWAASYEALRGLTFGPESLHLRLPVEAWAADGLLVVFFFIVGNELKHEFTHGELRNPRRAVLPIVAALCGAAVPALIFTALTWGDAGAVRGWGIPMATDIAFAVAILAVVGRHLPPALRTFLLTLAIVDDLVAIVVIAAFYTDHLALLPLAGAVLLLAVFGYLQRGVGPLASTLARAGLASAVVWVPLAVAIWTLTHASGVHATIAGASMGLLMRTRTHPGETAPPGVRMEHLLRPWAMGLALPLFALFSAGVAFSDPAGLFTEPVALGVIAGLVLGKLAGIAGGAWLTTKVTPAELNPSLKWIDIVGMSQLAGIGFTVSLLISELSYAGDAVLLANAKGAVLVASALATLLAAVILGARSAHYRSLSGVRDVRTPVRE